MSAKYTKGQIMNICTLTTEAKKKINEICKDKGVYAVSLNLKGGGCAGFEYEWGTVENSNEIESADYVEDTGAGNFVIGADTVGFMSGTEIDFTKSMVGSKFEIKNPNAEAACGCGVSMNFKTTDLSYSADNGAR